MKRPDRNEQFSSNSARVVFAAFRALPDALRWEVYRAALLLLAIPEGHKATQRIKETRAIAALQEALDLNDGDSPSIERYRALRREYPERGWPDDRLIRRWLGLVTWNDALERAHLPAVADGDALLVQRGPAFSREELRVAVRECAAAYGYPPCWSEYLSWARRPDVKAREGRRPLSPSPFEALYGRNWWTRARIDAGVIDGDDVAAGADGRIRTAAYFVSDEQIGRDLREVADRLGRSPRTSEYSAERRTIYEESRAAGRARALASYHVIRHRHGIWDNALVAHGLEPLGGRHTGKKTGPNGPVGKRVSDEVILSAIREGYEVLGDPYTQPAYSAWRQDEIALDPRRRRELPSYDTIRKRFGTWANACDVAFDEEGGDEGAVAA